MRAHTLVELSSLVAVVSMPTSAAAAVVPPDVCEVAVQVSAAVPLPWSDTDTRTFRREAEQVYREHGVDICWLDPGTPCPGMAITIYVRVAPDVPANGGHDGNALGWIGFNADGPGPFIVLSLRRAAALLGQAQLGSRRLSEMPGMVERLLPRALGRALAHELGHFLLERREHSPTGVMRASLRPEDVADPSPGSRGKLARDDAQRFVTRCAPASRPYLASR